MTSLEFEPPDAEPVKRKSRTALVAIILLSIALTAALAILTFAILQLVDANERIAEQRHEIDKQNDFIEKKETFGAAMNDLLDVAREFDGVLMASLVPMNDFGVTAHRAWEHRRNVPSLEGDIAEVRAATLSLQKLRSDAVAQAAANESGSKYEEIIDSLGAGFVSAVIDNADDLCEEDVLACVRSIDPYTVHFDAADNAIEYMTDWLRTGIAYHEFAHVLQFTNPGPTDTSLAAFDGDTETMADCFALTYLDGWTLDHTIWVSRYRYWEVSIGYGYTCNGDQRQVVQDWYEDLGFTFHPISQ